MKGWLAVISFGVLMLGSCGRHHEDEQQPPTDVYRLYHTTNKLLRECYREMETATDSATVTEAFDNLNSALDSLNFSVAADTDLQLTEGENDTTYNNIIAVRRLYDRRLRELAVKEND